MISWFRRATWFQREYPFAFGWLLWQLLFGMMMAAITATAGAAGKPEWRH
jgi:hypothetical protein